MMIGTSNTNEFARKIAQRGYGYKSLKHHLLGIGLELIFDACKIQ
jgi:hypothetical protein